MKKIYIACYLHRKKKIGSFAATQTSQAPGNLASSDGDGGSYKICSSPSSLWSTDLLSRGELLQIYSQKMFFWKVLWADGRQHKTSAFSLPVLFPVGKEHQHQRHWVAGYPYLYPRDWTPLRTNWQSPNAAGLCVPAAGLDSIPLRTVPAPLSSESTGCRICLSVNELVLFQASQNSAAVCGWC